SLSQSLVFWQQAAGRFQRSDPSLTMSFMTRSETAVGNPGDRSAGALGDTVAKAMSVLIESLPLKGISPVPSLSQDTTETKQIAALIDLFAASLFRSHVGRRSHDGTTLRQIANLANRKCTLSRGETEIVGERRREQVQPRE
ncbi:MAG: hypothetical protein RIS70_2654, partial [Planctomycetota bacterium]